MKAQKNLEAVETNETAEAPKPRAKPKAKPVFLLANIVDADGNKIEGATLQIKAVTRNSKTALDALMSDRSVERFELNVE